MNLSQTLPRVKETTGKKQVDKYPRRVYDINTPRGYYRESGETSMSEPKSCPHCGDRKKKRTREEKDALIRRLKLAEGQIRGIQKMLEEDAYCPDVLVQVSAVSAALNSFNRELLACHIRSCVAEDIREGKDEAIDEFVRTLQKLMK